MTCFPNFKLMTFQRAMTGEWLKNRDGNLGPMGHWVSLHLRTFVSIYLEFQFSEMEVLKFLLLILNLNACYHVLCSTFSLYRKKRFMNKIELSSKFQPLITSL